MTFPKSRRRRRFGERKHVGISKFLGKTAVDFRYKNETRTLESSRSNSMSHGTFDDAPSSANNLSGFGSGMHIFGANSVRERPQSVSSFQDINASSTLDESISKTFKRDIDRIVSNVKNVLDAKRVFLGNRNSNGEENSQQQQQPLRDWDLYGPLIFVLLFGVCLSSSAGGGSSSKTKSDAGTIFSVVFATVAFGAFALTLNVKFLGGKIIFLQAMSLIGYCIFPLDMSAVLCWVSANSWYRFFVVGLGVTWSCGASVPFVSAAVVEERKALAVYPMVLLYVTLGLFAAVVV